MKHIVCLLMPISILLLFSSCASVPKEAIQLSEELTGMIRSAEAAHLAMLDQYMAERRQRVNEFVEKTWIPKFMDNAVKDTKVLDLINAENDAKKKVELFTEFNEDAAVQITKRRASLIYAIEQIELSLREAIRAHYDDMLVVNQALTAHLSSAAKVTETREEIFAKLNIDPKKIIPLDKINGVLDKILEYKGSIEDIQKFIEEAKTFIKEK